MLGILNNRKASMLDWFAVIVIVMLAAISLFAASKIVTEIDDSGVYSDWDEAQDVVDKANTVLLNMDTMMLFIIIGLSLFVVLSSAAVYNHPAFFVISIVLLFIAVTVAGVMSNTFWIFTNSSAIAETAALYPKTVHLMQNIPLYILLLGFCAAAVMYISWRRQ